MRIVLAGAGAVNIEAAPLLKQKLPKATITLIAKHSKHTIFTHEPELLTNKRPEDIHYNVEEYCKQRGIESIIGTITNIDKAQKIVHVGEAHIPYDYLLLDLGSEPLHQEHTLPSHGTHNLLTIRHHIVTQISKAKQSDDPAYRTLIVVGANPVGIELAIELQALYEELCERHLFFKDELTVILISDTEKQQHMNVIAGVLEERGIEYYDEHIQSYKENGVHLSDRIIASRTIISTQKKPNSFINTIGITTNEYGAIVNEYLQTSDEHIYAAGECTERTSTNIPRVSRWSTDLTAAQNIIAAAEHKQQKAFVKKEKPYIIATGKHEGLLITSMFTLHGALPYTIREWLTKRYAKKITAR